MITIKVTGRMERCTAWEHTGERVFSQSKSFRNWHERKRNECRRVQQYTAAVGNTMVDF